jgi:hypothetical protein
MLCFKQANSTNFMNQKRYWLRGGVLFFCIASLIFGRIYFSMFARAYRTNNVISQAGLFMTGGADCHPAVWWNNLPEKYPGEKTYNDSSCQNIVATSIVSLSFFSVLAFLMGAFVGWMYGKIKNRKNLNVR